MGQRRTAYNKGLGAMLADGIILIVLSAISICPGLTFTIVCVHIRINSSCFGFSSGLKVFQKSAQHQALPLYAIPKLVADLFMGGDMDTF